MTKNTSTPCCRDTETSMLKHSDPATCSNFHDVYHSHIHLSLNVKFEGKWIQANSYYIFHKKSSTCNMLVLDIFHLDIQNIYITSSTSISSSFEEKDSIDYFESISEKDCKKCVWIIEEFTSFGSKLQIQVDEDYEDSFLLWIQYKTTSAGNGVCWLTSDQTSGKKYPFVYTQGQEVLNRSFFPCQDTPCVRITYSSTVSCPSYLTSVMSAKRINEVMEEKENQMIKRTSFFMNQSIPVYLVALAVGDLQSAPIGPRSNVWSEPCLLKAAQYEFEGDTEKYLSIGEKLFGTYQWEVYDILVMPPAFPYGGMENPRLTFVSSTLITGDKSLCTTIAHEIGHSWFGNLVTNSTWSDFFLNEGFTMYAERRITAIAYGSEVSALEATTGISLLRAEVEALGKESPVTRLRVPICEGLDPGDCYNICAYEKGYAFVCYLQHISGSIEDFDIFLQKYCKKFQFQSITAEEMLEYFQSYFNLNSIEMNEIFLQWLHSPGLPSFFPDVSSALNLSQQAQQLSKQWMELSQEENMVSSDLLEQTKKINQWPMFQILHFLDCCLEKSFKNKKMILKMAKLCQFNAKSNFEILLRYLELLIKNHLFEQDEMELIQYFFRSQGKQNFTIPIYRTLLKQNHPKMKEFAKNIYEETKASLHIIVSERIERLLHGP